MNPEDRLNAIIEEEIELNEKILYKNYDIHCETYEEAKILLTWAHKHGKHWCDQESFIDNFEYEVYGSDTCYDIYSGKFCYKKNAKFYIKFKDLIKD